MISETQIKYRWANIRSIIHPPHQILHTSIELTTVRFISNVGTNVICKMCQFMKATQIYRAIELPTVRFISNVDTNVICKMCQFMKATQIYREIESQSQENIQNFFCRVDRISTTWRTAEPYYLHLQNNHFTTNLEAVLLISHSLVQCDAHHNIHPIIPHPLVHTVMLTQ